MDEMIPFGVLLPEVARAETRDVTFKNHPLFPNDSFGFLEYYCPYPDCDCQMVMIAVLSKKQARYVATFAYYFVVPEGMEGFSNPVLGFEPLADYAEALSAWYGQHLEQDLAYRDRLKRHYDQVKEIARDPAHPAHAKYLDWMASLASDEAEVEERQPPRRRKDVATGKPPSVPVAMRPRFNEIVALTDSFCQQYLDEEYASMCRKMAAAIARKRSSPLVSGRASIWAAGIVYAVCQLNFAFDKTQDPHIKPDDIAAGFAVRKNTASQKAGAIRKLLKIGIMDSDWTLPKLLNSTPMAWLISVDGMIVDARTMPREIQYEAYRKGLIPYIPGDQE